MELINNLQAEIMEQLARFGFLAVSQLSVLTGKTPGYLREMLASLSRRGYIKSYRVEVSYKVRAENIYYLTEQSREFLLVHQRVFADDIKLPMGVPLVIRDYFHRYNHVSSMIAIWMHCSANKIPLCAMHNYFDKIGNTRKGTLTSKTAIPLGELVVYMPDGVVVTENNLYLLEVYCDKDTKRILSSLATHAKAIGLGAPGRTFGIDDNPFVLSVFQHDGIRRAVIKRLQSNDKFVPPMSDLFYFASLDEVKNNCSIAWETITGKTLVFS